MNNIEQIADKLRIAWNTTTGTNPGQTWDSVSPVAKAGYLAVAKAAVECSSGAEGRHNALDPGALHTQQYEKYRNLISGDIIQEGDEVWVFNRGPWEPVMSNNYGAIYHTGYNKMRRPSPTVAHLLDVNADQRVQIKHLGKEIVELKLSLHQCQSGNRTLENHNESLQKELGVQSQEWSKVISFVTTNRIGVIGHTFPEIVLEELQSRIDWKSHHDSLMAQADDAVAKRDQRLESAAKYIDGLESDLLNISNDAEHHNAVINEIGSLFGVWARIADDGSVSDTVIAGVLPGLVEQALVTHFHQVNGQV